MWEPAGCRRQHPQDKKLFPREEEKKGLDKLCRHMRRPSFESDLCTVIPDNFPRFPPLSLTSRLGTAHEERSVASSG